MVFIEEIIKDIEKAYKIKVNGTILPNHIINGVRFLDEKDIQISHLTPNVLYLVDGSRLSAPPLYGDILYTNCKGDVLDKSAFYISEDISVIEIYNIIERRFALHEHVESKIRNLFYSLQSGSGIETILQKAYNFLDNPIVVCDSSYSVLASYPEVEDERNLVFESYRLSLRTIFSDNMFRKKITEKIYHSVYPFVTKVEDYPFDWIFESIRIKRAVVGYVCIRCINRPYREYELDYIHALTHIISIEMQKSDNYIHPLGAQHNTYLKELFDKQFDRQTALSRLETLGVMPSKYYCIIATTFTNKRYKLLNSSFYTLQISSIFKNSITGIVEGQYITLISFDKFRPLDDKVKNRFYAFLKMNHMIAAISYTYSNLWNSGAYHNQSQALLNDMVTTNNIEPIGYYHEFYQKHLIQLIDNKERINALIHPAITQMQEYDKEHSTTYFETLAAYFENNRNAPATSKALFIHKSTLFYRFDKMKRLFSIDLENSYALFTYEFSVKLLETMRGKTNIEHKWF